MEKEKNAKKNDFFHFGFHPEKYKEISNIIKNFKILYIFKFLNPYIIKINK